MEEIRRSSLSDDKCSIHHCFIKFAYKSYSNKLFFVFSFLRKATIGDRKPLNGGPRIESFKVKFKLAKCCLHAACCSEALHANFRLIKSGVNYFDRGLCLRSSSRGGGYGCLWCCKRGGMIHRNDSFEWLLRSDHRMIIWTLDHRPVKQDFRWVMWVT